MNLVYEEQIYLYDKGILEASPLYSNSCADFKSRINYSIVENDFFEIMKKHIVNPPFSPVFVIPSNTPLKINLQSVLNDSIDARLWFKAFTDFHATDDYLINIDDIYMIRPKANKQIQCERKESLSSEAHSLTELTVLLDVWISLRCWSGINKMELNYFDVISGFLTDTDSSTYLEYIDKTENRIQDKDIAVIANLTSELRLFGIEIRRGTMSYSRLKMSFNLDEATILNIFSSDSYFTNKINDFSSELSQNYDIPLGWAFNTTETDFPIVCLHLNCPCNFNLFSSKTRFIEFIDETCSI